VGDGKTDGGEEGLVAGDHCRDITFLHFGDFVSTLPPYALSPSVPLPPSLSLSLFDYASRRSSRVRSTARRSGCCCPQRRSRIRLRARWWWRCSA